MNRVKSLFRRKIVNVKIKVLEENSLEVKKNRNYERYLSMLLEILRLKKTVYDEHEEIIDTLNGIAEAYIYLDQPSKCLEYSLESIELCNKLGIKCNDSDKATALDNIGFAYGKLGDTSKQYAYALEALNIRKALFKSSYRDIGESMRSVAWAHFQLGEDELFLKYSLDALQVFKEIFTGKSHELIVQTLSDIAFAYYRLVDFNNYKRYALEALNLRIELIERSGQDQSEELCSALEQVVKAYKILGNEKEALKYSAQYDLIKQQINSTLVVRY